MRKSSSRSEHSSIYALFFLEITNHGGNWNSTAPSLPAECSGISASWNRCHTSSTTSAGSLSGYRFFFSASSGGSDSRRSLYSRSVRVGCCVSIEYAFTLNVNSFGVRSIHSTEFRSFGDE